MRSRLESAQPDSGMGSNREARQEPAKAARAEAHGVAEVRHRCGSSAYPDAWATRDSVKSPTAALAPRRGSGRVAVAPPPRDERERRMARARCTGCGPRRPRPTWRRIARNPLVLEPIPHAHQPSRGLIARRHRSRSGRGQDVGEIAGGRRVRADRCAHGRAAGRKDVPHLAGPTSARVRRAMGNPGPDRAPPVGRPVPGAWRRRSGTCGMGHAAPSARRSVVFQPAPLRPLSPPRRRAAPCSPAHDHARDTDCASLGA